MNFQYTTVSCYLNNLNIDDIGNCALKGYLEDGTYYILIIDTVEGVSRIFECGPFFNNESGAIPKKVVYTCKRIMYSQVKVCSAIDKFLNLHNIVETEQLTREEALLSCSDILEHMKNNNF